jgi:hypothetical protein
MNRVHLATADEPQRDQAGKGSKQAAANEPEPVVTKKAAAKSERNLGGAFAGLKKLFGRET